MFDKRLACASGIGAVIGAICGSFIGGVAAYVVAPLIGALAAGGIYLLPKSATVRALLAVPKSRKEMWENVLIGLVLVNGLAAIFLFSYLFTHGIMYVAEYYVPSDTGARDPLFLYICLGIAGFVNILNTVRPPYDKGYLLSSSLLRRLPDRALSGIRAITQSTRKDGFGTALLMSIAVYAFQLWGTLILFSCFIELLLHVFVQCTKNTLPSAMTGGAAGALAGVIVHNLTGQPAWLVAISVIVGIAFSPVLSFVSRFIENWMKAELKECQSFAL